LSLAGVATKAITLVTALLIARYLGPTKTGELVAANTLIQVGLILADLGVTVLAMREIVGEPGSISRVVTATTIVQVLGALVLSGGVVFIAMIAPLPQHTPALLLLAVPTLIVYGLNFTFVLQAREDMTRVGWSRIISVGVTAVGSVALVMSTRRPDGAAIMGWVGSLTADILVLYWVARRHHVRPARVSLRECWGLLTRGLPFLQNGVLYIIILTVDTLSIALLGTARQVGEYSAGWSLSFSAATLALLITDATFPEMVKRFRQSVHHLRNLTEILVVLITRAGLAATALVVVEAPSLVRLLVGPSYAGSVEVLRILFWLAPIAGVSTVLGFVLVAAECQRTVVRLRVASVGIAVIGCPIAAAFGGIDAVASVILVSNITELTFFVIAARRREVGPSLRRWAGQLDYLIVPGGVLLALQLLLGTVQLGLAIPVWLLSSLIVEGRRSFPTLRLMSALLPREATDANFSGQTPQLTLPIEEAWTPSTHGRFVTRSIGATGDRKIATGKIRPKRPTTEISRGQESEGPEPPMS
jgi:PST family polysaccharide transporter